MLGGGPACLGRRAAAAQGEPVLKGRSQSPGGMGKRAVAVPLGA